MRKSARTTAVNGNVRKSDSFREAWARIKLARAHGFFLEAVAIEESIIFDRLLAYLHRTYEFPVTTPRGKHHSLNDLIKELRRREPQRTVRDGTCMADAIRCWADMRNQVVHSIVRSKPGTPTRPVDEFLSGAEAAAKRGEMLARDVSRMKVPPSTAET